MHATPATIRPLIPADAAAYTSLRREMLADSPWAFGASPEDDLGLDPEAISSRLTTAGYAIIGAFGNRGAGTPGSDVLAAAGISRHTKVKMAHRAVLWGVYTTPAARGRGLATQVVTQAIARARAWPGVTSVGLSVSARAPDALRLYRRLGFVQWGLEPACLVIDGCAYDEIHMVLFLHARGAELQPAQDA